MPRTPTRGASRWWRIGFFVGLIAVVQGAVAFLLTWIDPPCDVMQRTIDFSRGHAAFRPGAFLAGHEVQAPPGGQTSPAKTKKDALAILSALALGNESQPVVLTVRAPAVQSESGHLVLLAGGADDLRAGVKLIDVLRELKNCPARQKLLILDVAPPLPSAWRGVIYHDVAAAIQRELDAVADPDRLVLIPCSPGQTPHGSPDLGQSAFAHYVQEGLAGAADGYALRDGRITVKELAAFVKARVERWARHYRGAAQTPTLLGEGSDFAVAAVDPNAPPRPAFVPVAREYPEALQRAWRERDRFYQSGDYRLAARRFQLRQAWLQFASQSDAATALAGNLGAARPPLSLPFDRTNLNQAMNSTIPAGAKNAAKSFDEKWRGLEQQLADAKPADAERLKKRFIEQIRGGIPESELDGVVFAHAVADARLDPGAIRLCDQLLHPTPQSMPRSAETLRLRQLADLAMRIEQLAWPRDLVEVFLRATDLGEKAERQFPYLPGYLDRLAEPMQTRHDGEVRLLAHGYANSDEAKKLLDAAAEQFKALIAINESWQDCEKKLDETTAELPWYFEALEELPELREAWLEAAQAAAGLAASLEEKPNEEGWWLRTSRQKSQVARAGAFVEQMRLPLKTLHEPFSKDAVAQLERACRSPDADARTLRKAEAILSVAGPVLPAERRTLLAKAAQALSRRLSGEILALDRQDDESQRPTPIDAQSKPAEESEPQRAEWRARCQLAILELAGAPAGLGRARQALEQCPREAGDPLPWCALGGRFRAALERLPGLYAQQTDWRTQARLAWLLPPWGETAADKNDLSPVAGQRRRDLENFKKQQSAQRAYLARAFGSLNLESPGVQAARKYYTQLAGKDSSAAELRFALATPAEPLSPKQPYANVLLEVSRQGASGPVELRVHRPDDVWLDVAPESAVLPAQAHKVPLKITRLPGAERTGLPAPLGFLIEARCDGRSWHHLVTAPIIPSDQAVQILVSADADEPASTVNDIRVRPGKVKQPHYFYVRNLTNRPLRVHVEIKAGETLLHKSQKPMLLDGDGLGKVAFDPAAVPAEQVRGPLLVRVFDQERQKTLQEKTLRVEMLPPAEYVKVAQATYDPGNGGSNRLAVQLQAAKPVAGPAIAAQLVLPAQRIPGLLGVGGGTLRADLPAQAETPRVLFAENIRVIHAGHQEGPVYLHIDGVPRAFIYRTTFSRAGDPVQAKPDDIPAVRITAPACVMAGVNCLVDVEVDNAPPAAKLQVALGRFSKAGGFNPELTRDFDAAKKCRIDVEGAKDALVFSGSIADWTATFDTRNIVGARDLEARLIDSSGKVIALARQPIVIDDTPPVAHIVPAPAQVKRGSVLQVQAEGTDAESGIAQVTFFFGRPDKGEPPQGAPRFKAIPATRDRSFWMAPLLIPADHQGPLHISVQVVNHAGLAATDTITLEVTEREPGKTGLGEIHGKVTEGPRPQPNVLVTLLDQNGTEIARTRTAADGSYSFGQVTPARYRVIAVKPESQRRAVLEVTVEPDRPVRADLSLAL